MRARTEFQKRAERLAVALPELSKTDEERALRKAFAPEIWERAGRYWCASCGHEWEPVDGAHAVLESLDGAKCPLCGAEAVPKMSRKVILDQKEFFSVVTTREGVQVVRTYRIHKYGRMGSGRPVGYDISELMQSWHDEKGNRAVFCRPKLMHHYYVNDGFNYSKPMALRDWRKDSSEYYRYTDLVMTHKVIPVLKRNGFDGKYHGFSPAYLFHLLLTRPRYETLAKAGWMDFASHLSEGFVDCHWDTISICLRNGYRPDDMGLWRDLVGMLDRDGRDLRNAHYVCPADLKAAHDAMAERLRRKEEKERRERDLQRRMEQEAKAKRASATFERKKGRYFGIVISTGNFDISVLDSVKKYIEEGDAMHHCVFAMEYYSKPDSLILSAKDKEGNRLATVELSLKTFKVMQCRGACNGVPKFHDEIVSAVESHRMDFLKAQRKRA